MDANAMRCWDPVNVLVEPLWNHEKPMYWKPLPYFEPVEPVSA